MTASDNNFAAAFAPESECPIRSIGIIGYGKFGKHVAEDLLPKFAPHVDVKIYSRGAIGGRFVSFDEVAACDMIFLTVPIRSIEPVLLELLNQHTLRREAIIVDVASVKQHTVDLFRRHIGDRCRYLATHPMFGPESFKKRGGNVAGFRIVVCDRTIPDGTYIPLKGFLTNCGFNVVEVPAQKHDEHLAGTLFLTHYTGQIVYRAEFNRTIIDTVSFEYLMNAVDSVSNDTELFEDVYRYTTKECDEVLARFKQGQEVVDCRLAAIKASV